jgi:pSer/pThr/pTyr-binding forkhead associated (FHA) protein
MAMNLVLLLTMGACCWAGFELRQQRLHGTPPRRAGVQDRMGRLLMGRRILAPLARRVPGGEPFSAAQAAGPLDETLPIAPKAPPVDTASDQTVAIGHAELVGPSSDQLLTLIAVGAPVTLGRSDAEVLLRQPMVSARHAEFAYDGRTWTLVDLRSTNGTFVNGRRVDSIVLRAGDRICFGQDGPSFHFSPCR